MLQDASAPNLISGLHLNLNLGVRHLQAHWHRNHKNALTNHFDISDFHAIKVVQNQLQAMLFLPH